MKRVLTGPVFKRQDETEHLSIYAVSLPGKTGYFKVRANKDSGDITLAIEIERHKPDATGFSA